MNLAQERTDLTKKRGKTKRWNLGDSGENKEQEVESRGPPSRNYPELSPSAWMQSYNTVEPVSCAKEIHLPYDTFAGILFIKEK
jgi:hypothetical protein